MKLAQGYRKLHLLPKEYFRSQNDEDYLVCFHPPGPNELAVFVIVHLCQLLVMKLSQSYRKVHLIPKVSFHSQSAAICLAC